MLMLRVMGESMLTFRPIIVSTVWILLSPTTNMFFSEQALELGSGPLFSRARSMLTLELNVDYFFIAPRVLDLV